MFKRWKRLFLVIVSIRGGTNVEGTINEISENTKFRGTNVWLLACSTILCSIGLDLNSTAVIIGGMLISPLMSPILGVGLGVAILDRNLLKTALQSLGVATFVALFVSTVYFFFSPLGELTSEMSARTTPTILDVGVAFFGGVAGIVAGSRHSKTAAIPGVAIATAVMPPICVVGYGLSHFDTAIFLGAFYLYFINAFFIAVATYLISVFLKFPKSEQVDGETSTFVQRLIVVGAFLITIPSAILFYGVLQKLRFDRGVRSFVETEIRRDDRQPIRWDANRKDLPGTLKVYVVGKAVGEDEISFLKEKMAAYGLGDLGLKIVLLNISTAELSRISANTESDIAERLRIVSAVDEKQENEIDRLKTEIDVLRKKTDPDLLFLDEIKKRFPAVESASWKYAPTDAGDPTSQPKRILVIVFKAESALNATYSAKSDIEGLVRTRWPDETITVETSQIKAVNENANTNANTPQ
ncbi:MAG: DUF389 domain-containing protein [Pyrinomonadaceae bacterium]